MSQNIYDIIADLDHAEAGVAMMRFEESYMTHKWSVDLHKSKDGVEGKASAKGNDLFETLAEAKKKFDLLLGKGFVAASGVLLTASASEPERATASDDDMPF